MQTKKIIFNSSTSIIGLVLKISIEFQILTTNVKVVQEGLKGEGREEIRGNSHPFLF